MKRIGRYQFPNQNSINRMTNQFIRELNYTFDGFSGSVLAEFRKIYIRTISEKTIRPNRW